MPVGPMYIDCIKLVHAVELIILVPSALIVIGISERNNRLVNNIERPYTGMNRIR